MNPEEGLPEAKVPPVSEDPRRQAEEEAGFPGEVPPVSAGAPHAAAPEVAHHEVIDGAIHDPVFETEDLSVSYAGKPAVLDVTMKIPQKEITAFIGPSGCGKSTILRCFDRMNDLIPAASVGGVVRYHGVDLYASDVDAVQVRKKIGMVFQKPNPFPKSIYENIAFGPRVNGMKGDMDEIVETALQRASLWDDVKDRLKDNAFGMSGGQQQRLCIARALATDPDVLLMDEPCSALDPISTGRIEDLMHELKETVSIVIVTHNMQQAARVSDRTAFFIVDLGAGEDQRIGRLVEYGPTDRMFTNPHDTRTEEYISGKFG
ncbi:MAG: phosphate ABC transporter ATP-binding protein [Acidobacteria bacterium]|nr:phosphate ABC transporter ATP-binding protein [Acidobacteriota bacterium]